MDAIRKVTLFVLLMTAVASVHFLGFLRAMPEGIQRAAAPAFGVEFSTTFFFYITLAIVGARIGTYACASIWSLLSVLRLRIKANSSFADMKKYLREAQSIRTIFDWMIYALAPLILAVIYVDFIAAAGMALISLLVVPLLVLIVAPQLGLNPRRFSQRLLKPINLRTLKPSLEFMILIAVTLTVLSFFLGKARFAKLSGVEPSSIEAAEYVGKGVVLLLSDSGILVLERKGEKGVEKEGDRYYRGTPKRYILIRDGRLLSETSPANSSQFEPIKSKASP